MPGVTTYAYTRSGTFNTILRVTDNFGETDTHTVIITINNLDPIANASATPSTVRTNDTVNFIGVGRDLDGRIVKYEWDFQGDGKYDWTSTTIGTTTYSYIQKGTFTAIFRVTDDGGLTDTDTAVVVVVNRKPIANAGGNQTIYTLTQVLFNGIKSIDDSPLQYYWDFDDSDGVDWNNPDASGHIVTHSYDEDGTYIVTLYVLDDEGLTDTDVAVITILNRNPIPVPAAKPLFGTVDTERTFDPLGSHDQDGDIIRYEWDYEGDGVYDWNSPDAGETTYQYIYSGTYNAVLKVTDNDGGWATKSVQINVTNKPPTAEASTNLTTVYTYESLDFIGTAVDLDGTIFEYMWDLGDGTTIRSKTSGTTSYFYEFSGIYTATFSVRDNLGGTSNATVTVTVLNRAPIANAGLDQTLYIFATVRLDAGESRDEGALTYKWDFDVKNGVDWDRPDATGALVSCVYNEHRVFIVTLEVKDIEGLTSIDTVTITVLNRPPIIIVAEVNTTVIHAKDSVAFSCLAKDLDGTVVRYEWDFDGDGVYDWTSPVTGNTSHLYLRLGKYYPVLRITDDDGATTIKKVKVAVLNNLPIVTAHATPTTVHNNEIVTFTGSAIDIDGRIILYEWDFNGDGKYDWSNATTASVTHSFKGEFSGRAVLRATDNDGGRGIAWLNITVKNIAPIAALVATPIDVDTFEDVIFNASRSFDTDGMIVSYWFDFGDGTNSGWLNSSVTTYQYRDGTNTYTATLKVRDDGYKNNTNPVSIKIKVHNRKPIPATGVGGTYNNRTVTFDGSYSLDRDGEIVSYIWTFGDGYSSTEVTVTHTYTKRGSYTVTLIVTDDDGLTGTETVTIEITEFTIIRIRENSEGSGRPGTVVNYTLSIINDGFCMDVIDVTSESSTGWKVQIFSASDETLLQDTDGDGILDTGVLVANGGQINIIVSITIPKGAAGTDITKIFITSSVNTTVRPNYVTLTTVVETLKGQEEEGGLLSDLQVLSMSPVTFTVLTGGAIGGLTGVSISLIKRGRKLRK